MHQFVTAQPRPDAEKCSSLFRARQRGTPRATVGNGIKKQVPGPTDLKRKDRLRRFIHDAIMRLQGSTDKSKGLAHLAHSAHAPRTRPVGFCGFR